MSRGFQADAESSSVKRKVRFFVSTGIRLAKGPETSSLTFSANIRSKNVQTPMLRDYLGLGARWNIRLATSKRASEPSFALMMVCIVHQLASPWFWLKRRRRTRASSEIRCAARLPCTFTFPKRTPRCHGDAPFWNANGGKRERALIPAVKINKKGNTGFVFL